MSISNAMQTGISGLQATSAAVGRISENIANVATDGYRRSFAQMVTRVSEGRGDGSGPAGVRAITTRDISMEGPIRTTGRATDLAVSGQGFFVVAPEPGAQTESEFLMTRAGSFRVDEAGYMQNAAGYFLMGYPAGDDGTIGSVDRTSFADLEAVNLGSLTMPGSSTTSVSLTGNLPAQATGVAGDPFVSSATYYSPLGAPGRLEFSWQPSATTANLWTVTVSDGNGTNFGAMDVTFNAAGELVGAPGSYGNVTDLSGTGVFAADTATGKIKLSLPTGGDPQQISIDLGAPGTTGGITQFSGSYQPIAATGDGAEFGALMRTEFDSAGTLYGVFDNGIRKPLYTIPLAMVESPDNLTPMDGNAYKLNWASGGMVLQDPGDGGAGRMVSGALEGSNVEISEELTGLIQNQRAYSSNAKVITTADEMMEEALRLKR